MGWRIAILLLAPYVYTLILSLHARRSPQIEIAYEKRALAPCVGTGAQPTLTKRPRAADSPAKPQTAGLPVRGWRSLDLPGLRLETNLPERDAEFLAVAAWNGLLFLQRELGLPPADRPVKIRAFSAEPAFKAYAETVEAPPRTASFLDLTLDEIVVHRVNTWQLLGETLHQIAHARLRDAAPWLQEGIAEALAAVEFVGFEIRWKPGSPVESAETASLLKATPEEFSKIGTARDRRAACRALVEAAIREGRLRALLN